MSSICILIFSYRYNLGGLYSRVTTKNHTGRYEAHKCCAIKQRRASLFEWTEGGGGGGGGGSSASLYYAPDRAFSFLEHHRRGKVTTVCCCCRHRIYIKKIYPFCFGRLFLAFHRALQHRASSQHRLSTLTF